MSVQTSRKRIKATTALNKLFGLKNRIKVLQGGQGAGKTYAILFYLILKAYENKNQEIFIVSEELTKMRITVIKDFKKVMLALNIFDSNSFLAGVHYKFYNGSFIRFLGLDKADIGKGLRSDYVFVNEANKIDFETYRELTSRAKNILLDFNPNNEFWAHKNVLTRDDVSFLKLTFKDNEFISSTEKKEILRYKELGFDSTGREINAYWANKWRVYGLGEIGHIEGVVFDNWDEIDLPEDARLVGTGVDFGFTNDPTAVVDMYTWNDTYIFDEVLYRKEISNESLAMYLKNRRLIVCDSAEPKSIARLNTLGVPAIGSKKGPDSIRFGIERLLMKRFLVTKRSVNLINELRGYVWEQDKDNNFLNTAKGVDHACDSARYIHTYYDYYKPGSYIVG